MRSFIVSILILLVIIAGGIITLNYIEDSTDEMIEKNKLITASLEIGDFEKAEELAEELSAYVDKKRLLFSTTMDHASFASIEVYISEMQRYISDNVKYEALTKCAALDTLFRNLPRNYELRLENILRISESSVSSRL